MQALQVTMIGLDWALLILLIPTEDYHSEIYRQLQVSTHVN